MWNLGFLWDIQAELSAGYLYIQDICLELISNLWARGVSVAITCDGQ